MRWLDILLRFMPYIVLGYAVQGWIKVGLGIPGQPFYWGLPRTLWYTVCGTTAVLVIIINWLERKERQ